MREESGLPELTPDPLSNFGGRMNETFSSPYGQPLLPVPPGQRQENDRSLLATSYVQEYKPSYITLTPPVMVPARIDSSTLIYPVDTGYTPSPDSMYAILSHGLAWGEPANPPFQNHITQVNFSSQDYIHHHGAGHADRALQERSRISLAESRSRKRRLPTVAQRRAANIRERRRMFNLNEAFDCLRRRVPTFAYEKRLSRIETLRLAVGYISFMTDILSGKDPDTVRVGLHRPTGSGDGENSSSAGERTGSEGAQSPAEEDELIGEQEEEESCDSVRNN